MKPMPRFAGWLPVVAALLAILLDSVVFSATPEIRQVRTAKETTYLIEPLGVGGVPDYPAAINRKLGRDVKPEDNAVVILRQVVGFEDFPVECRSRYRDLLQVSDASQVGPSFLDWFKYAGGQTEQTRTYFKGALTRPWSQADYPEVHKWLLSNSKSIGSVYEAAQRCRYFDPMVDCDPLEPGGGRIPCLDARGFLWALTMRAMHRCHDKDVDGALQDLFICHKLICLAHSTSITGLAPYLQSMKDVFRGDQIVIANAALTEEQLEGVLRHLPTMPADNLRTSIEFTMRCLCIRAVLLDRQHLLATREVEGTLQGLNEYFDRLVPTLDKPTYHERVFGLRDIERVYGAKDDDNLKRSRSKRERKGFTAEELFWFHRPKDISFYVEWHGRCAMRHVLFRVGCAVEAYKRRNGRYPTSLSTVIPHYLGDAPKDVFDGKPIKYFAGNDGYFAYSVGANGTSDTSQEGSATSKESDDIVIRSCGERHEDALLF